MTVDMRTPDPNAPGRPWAHDVWRHQWGPAEWRYVKGPWTRWNRWFYGPTMWGWAYDVRLNNGQLVRVRPRG